MKSVLLIAVFLFSCQPVIHATNSLTMYRPGGTITRPGYIDKAVLVVEPQGAYAEQSLYLTYSDHGGFSGYNNVQITHRFELPQGSVINDMWLWIGDSIMQARIIDTWTGRRLYDSIVNLQRDPAYLFKNNNQYEIRVFPLTGGSFRKIKLNFVTPVRWFDNMAVVSLPIPLLKANTSPIKPLDVLFRVRETTWGQPKFDELPYQLFTENGDTMGFHYQLSKINNITSLQALNLRYTVQFPMGRFFQSREYYKGLNYFQYSLDMKSLFNLRVDSTAQKVLVAVDLSGSFSRNIPDLVANLKTALRSALRWYDQYNIIVFGANNKKLLLPEWQQALPENISATLTAFQNSQFADSLTLLTKKRLGYADTDAPKAWGYNRIDTLAVIKNFNYLIDAMRSPTPLDIIASYKHCFINIPDTLTLAEIKDSLNRFFDRGGRFVSYFNLDCNSSEKVVRSYIPSLTTVERVTGNKTLYRNPGGNIGLSFPEYFDHSGNNFLSFNDPTVKIEVKDALGRPAIVSKRISNGLLLATGIWLFNDDEPTRKLLAAPILGLNYSANKLTLPEMLTWCRDFHTTTGYQKLLLISNSDTLVNRAQSENYANGYIASFTAPPAIHAINLLNETTTTIPSLTVNGTTYAGAGYLLSRIAAAGKGMYFERKYHDWLTIGATLNPFSVPAATYLEVKASENGDTTRIPDFFEIRQEPVNTNSPRNFVGTTRSSSLVSLSVKAKFAGSDSLYTASFINPLTYEAGLLSYAKMAILGNEKFKRLYNTTPTDTAGLVGLAMAHRVLTDYTCLLALEPNDTIRFIKPFDESGLVPVELLAFTAAALRDSVLLTWVTATELNNQGFYIERGIGGSYQRIGFIAGAGTTTERRMYQYLCPAGTTAAGGQIAFRLVQVDFGGEENILSTVTVTAGEQPDAYALEQNYPNPFNPSTSISYRLPEAAKVELRVFDLLGNEVALLVNDTRPAGYYTEVFTAGKLASGTYLYSLRAGNYVKMMKMLLIK